MGRKVDLFRAIRKQYELVLRMRSVTQNLRFLRAVDLLKGDQLGRLIEAVEKMDRQSFDRIVFEIETTCLDCMSREMLRNTAQKYNIPYYSRLRNDELRERIRREQAYIEILRGADSPSCTTGTSKTASKVTSTPSVRG